MDTARAADGPPAPGETASGPTPVGLHAAAAPAPGAPGPGSPQPGRAPGLDSPQLWTHPILSLLAFDERVLALAADPGLPLLERLRFLTIFSSNLDELFEVRVAALKQQARHGSPARGPDGLSPREALLRISETAHRLVAQAYRLLQEQLLPALEAQGVRLLDRAHWSPEVLRWARRLFAAEVLPVLTPVGLDPSHPFPRVLNKGLSFVVALEGEDAFGRPGGVAVLQVPRSLPRLLRVPAAQARLPHEFVPLAALIDEHVADLFPGMQVTACYPFRITRDADLWVDEEEVDDLLTALKGELPRRNFGEAVRLEVGEGCPNEIAQLLLTKTGLSPEDVYRVPGPVNLNRLATLHGLVDRPDLKVPPFEPGLPARLRQGNALFDVLRDGDVLLHLPYESLAPVLELLRQAAADPEVVAIKQTLYRTGPDSPFVGLLIDAARAGKDVTVVLELRARFDEAANIELATRLEGSGVNLVYGIVGYKTHAKMLLIVRREKGRLRRYVHLATGNYHVSTARAYTDLGLLSADRALGEDVHALFQQLTGLGRAPRLKRLAQSPFTLGPRLLALIGREADEARAGRRCGVQARMNGLTDPEVVQALYRASQAGVPIDLVVRGLCVLRPGVPGVSETIRVRSVVGRFLEHVRVFRFHAAGEDEVYLSSADWMERNLHRRVEVLVPLLDARVRQRAVDEALLPHLRDDADAWELGPDGAYRRLSPPPGAPPFSAQAHLLARLARGGGRPGAERPADGPDLRAAPGGRGGISGT